MDREECGEAGKPIWRSKWKCFLVVRGRSQRIAELGAITSLRPDCCVAKGQLMKGRTGAPARISLWRYEQRGAPAKAVDLLLSKLGSHRTKLRTFLRQERLLATVELVNFTSAWDSGVVLPAKTVERIAQFGLGLNVQSYLCSDDKNAKPKEKQP